MKVKQKKNGESWFLRIIIKYRDKELIWKSVICYFLNLFSFFKTNKIILEKVLATFSEITYIREFVLQMHNYNYAATSSYKNNFCNCQESNTKDSPFFIRRLAMITKN